MTIGINVPIMVKTWQEGPMMVNASMIKSINQIPNEYSAKINYIDGTSDIVTAYPQELGDAINKNVGQVLSILA